MTLEKAKRQLWTKAYQIIITHPNDNKKECATGNCRISAPLAIIANAPSRSP